MANVTQEIINKINRNLSVCSLCLKIRNDGKFVVHLLTQEEGLTSGVHEDLNMAILISWKNQMMANSHKD